MGMNRAEGSDKSRTKNQWGVGQKTEAMTLPLSPNAMQDQAKESIPGSAPATLRDSHLSQANEGECCRRFKRSRNAFPGINRSRLTHRLRRTASEGTGRQRRQMRTLSGVWRRRYPLYDQLSGISLRDWAWRLETQHLGVCLLLKRLSAGSGIAGVQRYTP
jgi:hypothetical protein